MKIALLTVCYNEEYLKKWQASFHSKEWYCQLHGYSFLVVGESLDTSRNMNWSKIRALGKYLKDYDWIFCTDANSQIMKFGQKVEEIIDQYTNSKESVPFLLITKDDLCLNSSNFLIRNCKESYDFLDNAYQHYPPKPIKFGNITGIFHEQYGFYQATIDYEKTNVVNSGIVYLPQRTLNSYFCGCCGEKYHVGDFLIQFLERCPNKVKKRDLGQQPNDALLSEYSRLKCELLETKEKLTLVYQFIINSFSVDIISTNLTCLKEGE